MDESIEKDDKIEPSSSKKEYIKREIFDEYHNKEEPLESDLPQDNFVGQMEVKSDLNDMNDELKSNQNISVNPRWPPQNSIFKVSIKSQCDSEVKEEILESNSLEDNFVELSERKKEFCQPSDEFEISQKPSIPSTSKLKVKSASKEEILQSKSFKDYVAGLCKEKSEFSEPINKFLINGCYPKGQKRVFQRNDPAALSIFKSTTLELKPIQTGNKQIQTEKPIQPVNKQVQSKKPEKKFAQLIAEALLNSPRGGLVLSDIYKSISARYSYYKLENKTWQNTLRHTLTTNNNFTKTNEVNNKRIFNHWTFSKNPSQKLFDNMESYTMAVDKEKGAQQSELSTSTVPNDQDCINPIKNGVEIYKYVKGERDLTPINQTTSKKNHACFHDLKCSYCDKYFKLESDLQSHKTIHHKKMELNKTNWNYTAVESPESSEVPKAVIPKQQPDVIHTLEKPYICTFIRPTANSRYKYKCTFCDSSFKLESEVKKHILKFCTNVIIENKMLRHTCSNPPCNIPCTRSTMQYPIEYVHEEKKPYKGSLVHEHGGLQTCAGCGNKFEKKRDLNHHLNKIHKKNLLCKFCSREFKDNSNRWKHMKICKKSDQTTESECYSDTRKEIFGQKVKGVEIYKYEKGKRDLTPIHQTTKSFKDYLAQEKGEQLDTETQIEGEELESNLSEDNFVGLCEIKSEFSETNDEFMENQAISEIDPLEVKTENNSTVDNGNKSFVNCSFFEVETEDNLTVVHENGTIISYDSHKKSFLNCPKLSCNYKSAEKDELANHIASIHQGNIILDKSKNIPDIYQKIHKKQVNFHVDKKVKEQLGFPCPPLNCNFKTLLKNEIKDHMQSVHKRDIDLKKMYEPEVKGRALLSTSKPNVKSQKEILESKSFQDYVDGLIN